MKFRKKPIVVEAEQFTENHLPEGCSGNEQSLCCFINTLEGVMKADLGDWIITGIKGEKYPCKPDIFKMTYEKVKKAPEMKIYVVVMTHISGIDKVELFTTESDAKKFLDKSVGSFYGTIYKRELHLKTKKEA